MEIFKLFGSIFIDGDAADKKIDDIDKKAKSTGSTLGGMIGTAAKWGAGIAAGAATAGAGLFALASKVSDSASEINDMSVRTGLSTDRLQELKFATGQVGVQFDSITGAVGKLTKTMSGADEGSKAAAEAFKKMGIETSDGSGHLRNMDDIFPEVIKKLAGMTDVTDRNALAMSFFGKGALELVPLLDAGGEGIDAMTKQAHDLGLVLSKDAVDASDKFGDTLDAMKGALGGVVAKIGVSLMPTFQGMMDWVMAHMPEIQAGIETAVGKASDVIGWLGNNVLPIVIDAFNFMGDAIGFVVDNANIIIPILGGLAGAILAQMIIEKVVGFMKAWSAITKTQTTLQWLLNAAMDANPIGLVALAIGGLIAAGALLIANWDTVKEKLGELWDWMKDIGGKIKDFFGGVFDSLVDGFKWYVNKWIDGLNFLIRALNKIHFNLPDWIPGIGGKSFGIDIKEVPYLAKGTDDFQGGAAIVGEAGRELAVFPPHTQVLSNDKTEKLLGGQTVINIYNPVIRNNSDIDKLAQKFQNAITQRKRGLGLT